MLEHWYSGVLTGVPRTQELHHCSGPEGRLLWVNNTLRLALAIMTITMKVSLQTTVSEYISPHQFLMLACSWTIQFCVVAAMVCARGDHPYAIANSMFVGYLAVQLGNTWTQQSQDLQSYISNRWHYVYLEYSLQHLDRNYEQLGYYYPSLSVAMGWMSVTSTGGACTSRWS